MVRRDAAKMVRRALVEVAVMAGASTPDTFPAQGRISAAVRFQSRLPLAPSLTTVVSSLDSSS